MGEGEGKVACTIGTLTFNVDHFVCFNIELDLIIGLDLLQFHH